MIPWLLASRCTLNLTCSPTEVLDRLQPRVAMNGTIGARRRKPCSWAPSRRAVSVCGEGQDTSPCISP